MAEDSGQDKTEEPSDHKLQELRKKGNVPQSRDFTTAFVLFGGYAALAFISIDLGRELVDATTTLFRMAVGGNLNNESLFRAMRDVVGDIGLLFAPFLVLTAALGGVIQWLQVGPVFSMEKLSPKLENLDPIGGLKRQFLSARTYVELLKSLIKLAIVGIVCWKVIESSLPDIVRLSRLPLLDAAARAGALLERMVRVACVCFLGLGVFDLLYQRFQFLKENRMTKEEVKREYKQMEGDPEVKWRLKKSRMERMQGAMYRNLGNGGADIVATNPTHVAVALRFDPKRESAPRVVAKGKGFVAQRIKEIAARAGIPIKEDPPLARTLVKLELNKMIPEELAEAVAELLFWVAEQAHERGELAPWEERVKAFREESGELAPEAN